MAVTAVGAILTGGESRRMGRDKATLTIGGIPMALRIARAIAPALDQVVAVGRPAPELAAAGLEVIADRHPGQGPLGGILTAFAWSPAPLAVVVACDLIDLDRSTVEVLVRALEDDSTLAVATAAREPGDAQPLCAAWRIDVAAPVLTTAFEAGERSIRRAWADLARICVPVLADRVRNVNAPTDVPSPHGHP